MGDLPQVTRCLPAAQARPRGAMRVAGLSSSLMSTCAWPKNYCAFHRAYRSTTRASVASSQCPSTNCLQARNSSARLGPPRRVYKGCRRRRREDKRARCRRGALRHGTFCGVDERVRCPWRVSLGFFVGRSSPSPRARSRGVGSAWSLPGSRSGGGADSEEALEMRLRPRTMLS